jgi:hypothetical protein
MFNVMSSYQNKGNRIMKTLFLLILLPFFLSAQENNDGSTIASTFINSLTSSQKAKTLFAFDDNTRYHWHYFPSSTEQRNGIAMKDLENYLVAFYGSPGKNNEWGWKFSGHHVALNFTVVNDTIAFAPFFFGSDPAIVRQGPKKGLRAIKEEEDLALELINSFTTEQKQKAIFQTRAFSDIVTGTYRQVTPLQPVGILVSEMSEVQYELLKKLLRSYVSSMPAKNAEMRMKKIAKEDMNTIRFGWAGATELNKPHYYRIQGKTFLIEFDNAESNGNHIHLLWRDFNGDFGTDLLKEHYKTSKHHRK